MNDFTVLNGDDLKRLKSLEEFHASIKDLVDCGENLGIDSIWLSALKDLLDRHSRLSN